MTTSEQRPIGKLLPTRFIWKIDEFSKLNEEKYYSDVFVIGGCKWKLLIFPKGGKNESSLGLFLGIADCSAQLEGWSVEAEFSLALIDQVSKKSIVRNSEHRFAAHQDDRGYWSFMPLSDLRSPEKGYIVNDTCVVEAGISVRKVDGYRMYNDESKKEATGGPVDAAAPAKVTKWFANRGNMPFSRSLIRVMVKTVSNWRLEKQKSGVLETAKNAKKTEDASATSLKQKPEVDEKPEMDSVEAVPPDGPLIKIPHYRRLGSSGYSKELDGYITEREVRKLAYHSVLQYLYLQGDHKWKNEVWLTELRGALGVSNDDHAMELKRVIYGEHIPL